MPPEIQLGPRLRASELNAAELYALLEERSAWLRSKGLTQWNPVYPRARFTREIAAGHVWYWKTDGDLIATVTLFPERPDYYPADVWNDALPAWYICRLAVARRHAGAAVGRSILKQLELDAASAQLSALRLDINESSPFLERYYGEIGYVRVALAEIKGRASVFMEKRVGASSRL